MGKQRARRVTSGLPPMQSGSSLAAQRRAVSDDRFSHPSTAAPLERAGGSPAAENAGRIAKPQVENEGESPVPCKRCGRACVWPIIERPSVLEEDEALLAHLGLRLAIWSGTSLHGSMHPASRSRAVDRSQDILPGGRRAGKRVSWAEGLADDRAPSSRGEWWGVLQEFQRLGGSLAHTIKTGLGLGGGLCQSKPNGLAALLHQRGSMVIVALRDDANEGVQAARENVVAFAGLQKTQDVPCQWCSRRHRGSSTTSPEGKAAGSESGSGNGGCREQARTSPHGPTKVRVRQEGVEEEALVRQGDARQLKTQVFFSQCSCVSLYSFVLVRARASSGCQVELFLHTHTRTRKPHRLCLMHPSAQCCAGICILCTGGDRDVRTALFARIGLDARLVPYALDVGTVTRRLPRHLALLLFRGLVKFHV